MEINKLLTEDYLKNRFKVYESPNLFDMESKEFFAVLKDNRCPICTNRLKFMRNGKWAYCKGILHRKVFIISIEKLRKINGK